MLYPYILVPRNSTPSPDTAHFNTISDAIRVMEEEDLNESHRAEFLHKDEPSDTLWCEIIATEAMLHGGWFEIAYQLARYRFASPKADLFPDGHGEDYERSMLGWRLGINKPRLLRPTNLEWGFYGVWRRSYIPEQIERDPITEKLFNKLCPPSIAWAWALDCYLDYAPEMTLESVRSQKLDNVAGRHTCNNVLGKVATNEETWKTSIRNTIIN